MTYYDVTGVVLGLGTIILGQDKEKIMLLVRITTVHRMMVNLLTSSVLTLGHILDMNYSLEGESRVI